MNSVVSLIKNNKLNSIQREKINKILFLSYEKLAVKNAIDFKKYHYYKCRNININDLILASRLGLFKSINKYNGNSSFIYFSGIYIKSELFMTLTSHFSLSVIPKKERMKSKSNFTKMELYKYKKLLEPSWVGYSDYWRFDKYNKKTECILDRIDRKESRDRIWEEINKLDPTLKKIIHYKYDYDFNTIRSNREIGELIAYSEEYVRLKINKFKLLFDTTFKKDS
jgi:RNA polymerase sigma factor (sigma-70 family)